MGRQGKEGSNVRGVDATREARVVLRECFVGGWSALSALFCALLYVRRKVWEEL